MSEQILELCLFYLPLFSRYWHKHKTSYLNIPGDFL